MLALIFGDSDERTLVTPEDDGAARNLMLEYFVVIVHLRTPFVVVFAFKHNFCQQILGHTIHLIEL
jgi:hypothetical protein